MRRISSRSNALVARFRAVARGRGPEGLVLLDGEHLVEDALAAGITLETVALVDPIAGVRAEGLAERAMRAGASLVRVPHAVMAAMSPVRQPAGVTALAQLRAASVDDALARAPQLVLVLAGIQDAGNVGAIVRTAEACGATGVVATDGTADPFGWKALRGAMGSSFRVAIAARASTDAVIADARRRGISIVAAVPRDGRPLPDADLRAPVAILLGGEGAGLPHALVAAADQRLSIPMRAPVESLNVAVTAALILYEAARQREAHVPVLRS